MRLFLPVQSHKDKTDGTRAHSEPIGECLLGESIGGPKNTYLSGVGLGELASAVAFATSWIKPTLGHLVISIILVRAQKEVRRIYATGIVAVMANAKAVWDGSDVNKVRDAVSREPDALYMELAIPLSIPASSPLPASLGVSLLRYLNPEIGARSGVEGGLYRMVKRCSNFFSGRHSNRMAIVRALGSLSTTPVLAASFA